MPIAQPFEEHTDRYDRWFDEHELAYRSELAALRRLLPDAGESVEIGVGTGRFAAPLGVEVGVDPSRNMLRYARDRGLEVVEGVAEWLPFQSESFDVVLFVTTVCFVDDLPRALTEAGRALAPDGLLVLGYIDRDSPVGRMYEERKEDNPFYRDAEFVATGELVDCLEAAGFNDCEFVQTIFRWPGEMEAPDPIETGYGEGSFVGIAARQ